MEKNIYKDSRIDLRIEVDQKKFLVYAASLRDMKLSSFVVASALKEAEEIVADKISFALPEKKWKAFCAALDRPARTIPKLKKLFTDPSVFDAEKE